MFFQNCFGVSAILSIVPRPFSVGKQRNNIAAKHDKLVGAKHQAVKTLFEIPVECRDEILGVVSFYGWDGFSKTILIAYFFVGCRCCLLNNLKH